MSLAWPGGWSISCFCFLLTTLACCDIYSLVFCWFSLISHHNRHLRHHHYLKLYPLQILFELNFLSFNVPRSNPTAWTPNNSVLYMIIANINWSMVDILQEMASQVSFLLDLKPITNLPIPGNWPHLDWIAIPWFGILVGSSVNPKSSKSLMLVLLLSCAGWAIS